MTDYLQVAQLTELTLVQVNRLVNDVNARLVTIGQNFAQIKGTDSVSTLTDLSGGRGGDTVPKIPQEYKAADIANAVASLARKDNELIRKLKSRGIIG